jgi:hypothetical protein
VFMGGILPHERAGVETGAVGGDVEALVSLT